jgi:hypothetical protein
VEGYVSEDWKMPEYDRIAEAVEKVFLRLAARVSLR